MSRFSRYDTDEERLPDGMTRVGYDADTQVYTFEDSDGSLWESAPGCEYGQLYRVGATPNPDDTEPFPESEQSYPQTSWRAELMPLLNFGLLIGLSLLLLFWYLHIASKSPETKEAIVTKPSCPPESFLHTIQEGDTCWDLAQDRGITIDDVVKLNDGINCDRLLAGSKCCLPRPLFPE